MIDFAKVRELCHEISDWSKDLAREKGWSSDPYDIDRLKYFSTDYVRDTNAPESLMELRTLLESEPLTSYLLDDVYPYIGQFVKGWNISFRFDTRSLRRRPESDVSFWDNLTLGSNCLLYNYLRLHAHVEEAFTVKRLDTLLPNVEHLVQISQDTGGFDLNKLSNDFCNQILTLTFLGGLPSLPIPSYPNLRVLCFNSISNEDRPFIEGLIPFIFHMQVTCPKLQCIRFPIVHHPHADLLGVAPNAVGNLSRVDFFIRHYLSSNGLPSPEDYESVYPEHKAICKLLRDCELAC